jgi:hypothetical protein
MIKMCLSLCFLFSLSACQVYRNNGRNLFESSAPGKINPNTGLQIEKNPTPSQTCWQQFKNDVIWTPKKNQNYTVQEVSSELIEVCVDDSVSKN